MNLEKCTFKQKSAITRFPINRRRHQTWDQQVEGFGAGRVPHLVQEVRQFLRLCYFFRTHVKNFAQISAPLTWLARKDSPWKAGDLPSDALKSLREIQSCLVSEPVMGYPRKNRKY